MITLYNTATQKKEPFKPKSDTVTMYACGVTVYDYCHIGHARAYVTFDIVRRVLESQGHTVKFIQNFTDIDDKIIKRAQELNMPYTVLTQQFIEAYHEDFKQLNVKAADSYPRATAHIPEMIQMIQDLLDKGHAYEAHGDIFFAIDTFEDYGKLSKKVLDDLEAGNRVEVDTEKKNPFDFVLWKSSKPGEPFWESPFGQGRPGWHIECSAMATKCLGDTIDIHAGGEDLVFPHHENEIAQSECCTSKPFANYWIHNGFVNIRNEKMSKSKKNFFTIREVLKEFEGETLRFFLLKVHYRTGLSFSFDGLTEAEQALERLHNTLKNVKTTDVTDKGDEFTALEEKFMAALCDDFNTAEAIGVLFELNKVINTVQCGTSVLKRCGELLGLFYTAPTDEESLPQEVQALVEARIAAKKEKNFTQADAIRAQIQDEHGILIEDSREGLRWKRIRV